MVKQRTLAKRLCEEGRVDLNGKPAKAGKEIKPGDVIGLDLRREQLELKVVEIPQRNFKRTEGARFYELLRQEFNDPYL